MDGPPRKFSGVTLNKKVNRYRARYYKADGSRSWLKQDFASAEAAARAYDAAVLKDGLPAQTLNFVSPLNALRNSASKFKPKADPSAVEANLAVDRAAPAPAPAKAKVTLIGPDGVQWPRKRKRDYSSEGEGEGEGEGVAVEGGLEKEKEKKKAPTTKARAPAAAASGKTLPRKRPRPPGYKEKQAKNKKNEERGSRDKDKDKVKESSGSGPDADSKKKEPGSQQLKGKGKAMRSKGSKRKSKTERKRLRGEFEAKAKEEAAKLEAGDVEMNGEAAAAAAENGNGFVMPDLEQVRAAGVPTISEVVSMVGVCRNHPSYKRYFGPVAKKAQEQKWVSCGDFEDDDDGDDEAEAPVRLFSLDCEMVLCRPADRREGKAVSTLARASLVQCFVSADLSSTTYKVVFDEYVRVGEDAEVVDLLTHVSGIRQSDLDDATLTKKDVQQLILKHVRTADVIVGHSLWADFAAAEFWHEAVVDTSSLCAVRGLANVTLSLKDVARGVLMDKVELEQFQEDGKSHDSIADAEWSLRVMFRLITLAKVTKTELPLIFDEIPVRYRTRLTFHMLPEGTVQSDVETVVQRYMPSKDGSDVRTDYIVKPIRWHVNTGSSSDQGGKQGSCIVELGTPEVAKHIFDAMQVVPAGCGGFPKSGPCHPEGFPDRQNMMRKLIFAPGTAAAVDDEAATKAGVASKEDGKAPVTSEVICFFPVKLLRVKRVQLRAQTLGRVLGRAGTMIRMIQQVSGARVHVSRQPDKASSDSELRDTAQLEVAAETGKKMTDAVGLIHLCVKNRLKLN